MWRWFLSLTNESVEKSSETLLSLGYIDSNTLNWLDLDNKDQAPGLPVYGVSSPRKVVHVKGEQWEE